MSLSTRGPAKRRQTTPLFQNGDYAIIKKAINRLPPRQRQIITMRFWENSSLAEIAGVLHTSWATVSADLETTLFSLKTLCFDDPEFSRSYAALEVAC